MADRTFRASFHVEVEITVPEEAISRVVNNEDGWREQLYDLRTEREVVEHLARNMGVQGSDLTQLDGWADMPRHSGRSRVLSAEMDSYEEVQRG